MFYLIFIFIFLRLLCHQRTYAVAQKGAYGQKMACYLVGLFTKQHFRHKSLDCLQVRVICGNVPKLLLCLSLLVKMKGKERKKIKSKSLDFLLVSVVCWNAPNLFAWNAPSYQKWKKPYSNIMKVQISGLFEMVHSLRNCTSILVSPLMCTAFLRKKEIVIKQPRFRVKDQNIVIFC